MAERRVRIGCASGFWGDSPEGARQLIAAGDVDFLVFDYLSEVTMSLLARARGKNADDGYARDFVEPAMACSLPDIAAQGIKVVANAGGVNLQACRKALAGVARAQGLDLKIAIVSGDDLMPQAGKIAAAGVSELDSGAALPEKLWSINAYLGALPIAAALADGADVVITGRCVDSALALGPLIQAFGWSANDYDRLAAGSLAGHIVECGVQAVGGNFTDWEHVEGWDNMGYPIVDCAADGNFVVTKPAGTGGLVTPLTVAEQLLYELGDPAAYILPDVVCDFTGVTLTQRGEDEVEVRGAKGWPPTSDYKVSATYQDGYRATAMFTMVGRDNLRKVERVGESILARTRRMFRDLGYADYRRSSLKIVGAEEAYGENARPGPRLSRELVLRLDVHHDQAEALRIFATEIAPAGLAMGPGRCSLVGGRPRVTPLVRLFSFLWPKKAVEVTFDLGEVVRAVEIPTGAADAGGKEPLTSAPPEPEPPARTARVPLIALAVARSGDKGDKANIGVIARRPELLPYISRALTCEAVGSYFSHVLRGRVERFELPGICALNFVLHEALDGGGAASLRNDPLGKCFAQMLLDYPVAVPEALLEDPEIARAAEAG